MSVGALPLDDELERERQRQAPGAPGVIKIDEPIVIDAGPPPAPYRSAGPPNEPRVGVDPTEPSPMALLGQTNASIPGSPLPGGDLTAEQLAAAATTTTTPADETDRVLAANPIPPPLPPPAPPPGPLDVRAEAEKTIRGQGELSAQAEAAEQREGKARQEIATAEQTAAEEKARVLREEVARQQQALDAANARTQAWLDKAEAEADKHAKMEYKDFWADKSTGQKVLAGLAYLFGAAGKTDSRDNPGMRIIDNAIERDFRLQQARIEKQGRIAAAAREGHRSALSQLEELRADLALKKAAALESVAAEGEALKRKSGVSLEQAATDKNIVGIRQKAADTRMGALDRLHQWNVQDEELKIGHERTAAMMARARKAKGGGGGGSDAFSRFVEAAGQLAPGDPIPPEVAVLARQAGLKPNQVAGEIDKYRNSGAKAAKGAAAGGDLKVIDNAMKDFQSQAVGTSRTLGPVRVLSQIEAMRHGLEEAIASGDSDRIKSAAVKAKEQAGTIMSGGKLTNAQIKILHTLESSADDLTANIGKLTGNPTEGKGLLRRLTNVIEDAGQETLSQVADIRQRGVNQMLAEGGMADTPQAKKRFLQRNAGIYSAVKWMGKQAFPEDVKAMAEHGKVAEDETPTAPRGGPTKLGNRDLALKVKAQKVVADPKADPQEKRDAQAFLDRIGG